MFMDIAMQRLRMVGDAMKLSSLSKTVGLPLAFIPRFS